MRKMKEQSTSLQLGQNSFDYFRLFAAIQVLLGHMVSLYGIRLPAYIPLHFVGGVPILFTLCGFLVTASYEKSESTGAYFKKRFFRIFPPLWISVWVGFIVLWIFFGTSFPVGKAAVWTFLQGLALQYTPGFAEGFGSGTFNGALWALFTEMQFYLLLPVFYRFMKRKNMKTWLIVGLALLAVQVAGTRMIDAFNHRALSLLWKRCILAQSNYFYIGSFLYVFKDHLLMRITKYSPLFLLAYTAVYVTNHFIHLGVAGELVVDCLLPVLIVTLGYYFGRHRLQYDISYGIYLYHVMIINIFLELNVGMNVGVALLIILLSCICGIVSLLIDRRFRNVFA